MGSGAALPGAPGSPLAERSNLIDASAASVGAEGVTKKRRPNALLSPLGANKPELPQMLDGGRSPVGTPPRERRHGGAGARSASAARKQRRGERRATATASREEATAPTTALRERRPG